MQITQLPTIPQAPADADVMAIEVGGVTYKVSKSVLAGAILSALGGDPVTVDHGGTGATSASAARTALDVYSKSETQSSVRSLTQIVTQNFTPGSTMQLNSDILSCGIILLIFRRYGYWDSVFLTSSMITGAVANNGAHINYNGNDVTVIISTAGVITMLGTGASDLAIDAFGLFKGRTT